MRVLGIDPGTRNLGYGLIEMVNGKPNVRDYGVCKINPDQPFANRLLDIHGHVAGMLKTFDPASMAVEEVYVSKNAKITLKLGHTRGVILLAGAQSGIPVFEYAPREIKQAVIGRGNASKDQIVWMMSQMLKIDGKTLKEDAADGLAVALCHGMRHSGAGQVITGRSRS